MIKSVTVTNPNGESLKLELRRPELSGFLIQEITGLGPCQATINSTELATNDGALFNSSRVASRNIVMTLRFLENPTIEITRQRSYKFFPIKKRINFLIETDERICEAWGYVESNEPNLFSSASGTQISIICPDPYFYSAGPDGQTLTVFNGLEPSFEFPFGNESLAGQILLMGVLQFKTEQTIYYSGDAEVGIVISLKALDVVQEITIYNTGSRETMFIDTDKIELLTGSGIIGGDEIVISTVKNDKYAVLVRNGTIVNILNCIDRDSDWFKLVHGDNIFAYGAVFGIASLTFRIVNQTVYEGV